MHVTDWLPTIVDLAGGSVPESDGLDGFVQTDMVINNGASARTSMIYNIDRESEIGQPKFGEMAARLVSRF
jgi:arylsulfatase A-like enzyme